MLAREVIRNFAVLYENIDPVTIHPMELIQIYVALLDTGDERKKFTENDFPYVFE